MVAVVLFRHSISSSSVLDFETDWGYDMFILSACIYFSLGISVFVFSVYLDCQKPPRSLDLNQEHLGGGLFTVDEDGFIKIDENFKASSKAAVSVPSMSTISGTLNQAQLGHKGESPATSPTNSSEIVSSTEQLVKSDGKKIAPVKLGPAQVGQLKTFVKERMGTNLWVRDLNSWLSDQEYAEHLG